MTHFLENINIETNRVDNKHHDMMLSWAMNKAFYTRGALLAL